MKFKRSTILLILSLLFFCTFLISQQNGNAGIFGCINDMMKCLVKKAQYIDSLFVVIDPGHGCFKKENTLYECSSGKPGTEWKFSEDGKNYTISEACLTTELALRDSLDKQGHLNLLVNES